MKTKSTAIVVALLLAAGCVSVHKKTTSTETIRDYTCVTNKAGDIVRVVTHEEVRQDVYRDGGVTAFADPKVSILRTRHENQSKLGGGSQVNIAEISASVSTNTAPIIGAGGTALGNIIGAAVDSSTGSGGAVKTGTAVANKLIEKN